MPFGKPLVQLAFPLLLLPIILLLFTCCFTSPFSLPVVEPTVSSASFPTYTSCSCEIWLPAWTFCHASGEMTIIMTPILRYPCISFPSCFWFLRPFVVYPEPAVTSWWRRNVAIQDSVRCLAAVARKWLCSRVAVYKLASPLGSFHLFRSIGDEGLRCCDTGRVDEKHPVPRTPIVKAK